MGSIKKILVVFLIMLCAFCYKEQGNEVLPKQYTIPAIEKILVERSNQLGFETFDYLLSNKNSDENILVSPIGLSFSLNSLMSSLNSPARKNIKLYFGISGLVDSIVSDGFNSLYKIFTDIDKNTLLKDINNFSFPAQLKLSEDFLSFIKRNKNIGYTFNPNEGIVPDNFNTQEKSIGNGFQLVSTLDFKARGKYQKRIEKLPFYYSPDKSDFIEMVVAESMYNYYGDAMLKAIEIPLGRGNFNMLIIIPTEGQLIGELAFDLNIRMLDRINHRFKPQFLEVYMPKLNVSSDESYTNHLKKGRLNSYFLAKDPNLSGIVEGENCFLTDYEQITNMEFTYSPNVELDNNTGILNPNLNQKESFFIDRPFLFVIYEKYSEGIIFIGKIVKP
jgi:serine protease inhibitor